MEPFCFRNGHTCGRNAAAAKQGIHNHWNYANGLELRESDVMCFFARNVAIIRLSYNRTLILPHYINVRAKFGFMCQLFILLVIHSCIYFYFEYSKTVDTIIGCALTIATFQ